MEENSQQPLPKRHDFQTSADLERVTDYAEEKEISAKDLENVSIFLWCVCVKFNYSGRNVSLNNFGHLSTIVYSAGITLEPFSTSFLVSPLKIFTLSWHSLPSCTLRVVRDSNCPYYCPNARSQANFQSGQFNIVLSLSWKCQEGSQDYSQTLC